MNGIAKILLLGAGMALAVLPPAWAHHSAAMFDQEKSITLAGTVRELQWTNPHCWIQLLVMKDGATAEWSIEMGAPFELFRGGWKPGTLKPGDKIIVVASPARDGSTGAQYRSATRADGQPIGKPK